MNVKDSYRGCLAVVACPAIGDFEHEVDREKLDREARSLANFLKVFFSGEAPEIFAGVLTPMTTVAWAIANELHIDQITTDIGLSTLTSVPSVDDDMTAGRLLRQIPADLSALIIVTTSVRSAWFGTKIHSLAKGAFPVVAMAANAVDEAGKHYVISAEDGICATGA